MSRHAPARLLTALLLLAAPSAAETFLLSPGDDLQAAVDGAADGDVLQLLPGVYEGDLDFGGKLVRVTGSGPHTVLQGTGTGPVVTFASGESVLAVLEALTVTGGSADDGGGILIDGASPTIVRCTIRGNQASDDGSGVYIGGGSTALLFNNVIAYNTRSGSGDPHGVQIVGSAPALVNNTIVRHDSNGILIAGSSAAVIRDNIIAWNGSEQQGGVFGRGICDFSGGAAWIVGNDFHRNRVSALLRGGKDWKKVGKFQKQNADDPRVFGNVDGHPGFLRRPPKQAADLHCLDLLVCDGRKGKAVDGGLDDPDSADLDGSRNTAGHTGGPFAAGSLQLPAPADGLPP